MLRAASLGLVCLAVAMPAKAEDMRPTLPASTICPPNAICQGTYTPAQLFDLTQQLVMAKRYAEAEPLLRALQNSPQFAIERQFLEGYVLIETGNLKAGEKKFRAVLDAKPEMTRARLELARTLYLQGHNTAADYHFRVSQRDQLPAEVAAVVSQYRRVISEQRPWRVNMSFGFAPDTNFNAATSDRSVDLFGLPFDLNEDARRKSGIGQTAAVSGSVRLKLSANWAMGVEAAGRVVNYRGSLGDDIIGSVAIGPQGKIGETEVRLAATAANRWYGGRPATRLIGAQFSASRPVGDRGILGLELSARSINNLVNNDYDGWQYGAAMSYERPVSRALAASVSVFTKYEPLREQSVSSFESGLAVGFGGELPLGLNVGTSLQASRAWFSGVSPQFGDTRKDLRLEGRASLTFRQLRMMGFAPMVAYSYASAASTLSLYDFGRHRIEFSFSRTF
jgi:outer membrane protein